MDTNTNQDAFLALLKKIPLFAELNDEQHREIIANIVLEYYPKSHTLFREGEAGDKMYIIKNGLVKIAVKKENNEDEVATLSTNDFFGEMALISDEPRNATAETITDAELFALRRSDFFKLIEKTPGLANQISTEFIKRIKKNEKK